jgi:hypothetical protein
LPELLPRSARRAEWFLVLESFFKESATGAGFIILAELYSILNSVVFVCTEILALSKDFSPKRSSCCVYATYTIPKIGMITRKAQRIDLLN